jgi:tRNA(fMet)-specific endonuclease VapC
VDGLLVVDTSILVATERGGLPLDTLHQIRPGARPAVSAITVSELLHGYHRARSEPRRLSREQFIAALLSELEVLPFDLAVAREHARIWASLAERGEIIGPYDLIIAATAVAYQSPLATLNFREFQKIEALEVLPLSPSPAPRRRRGRSRQAE